MKQNYQTTTRRGRTTPKKARLDADRAAGEAVLRLPENVTVAISDLTGELEEPSSERGRKGGRVAVS